jgi:hypothetical protein
MSFLAQCMELRSAPKALKSFATHHIKKNYPDNLQQAFENISFMVIIIFLYSLSIHIGIIGNP